MINALNPDRMTTDERLDEVAEILAIGIIRLQSRKLSSDQGDSSLDFSAPQSVHVCDEKPCGETK